MFALLATTVITSRSVTIACLEAVFLFLAYAYSPQRYSVLDRAIVIERLIGNVRIPLDALSEVRAAAPDDIRGNIRLFGSGGLFGYYGLFRNSKLGKSSWYVTNRGKIVVVVTQNKTALFSPDDPEGFVSAVLAAVPAPRIPEAASDSNR